jgi:hypothetical protein
MELDPSSADALLGLAMIKLGAADLQEVCLLRAGGGRLRGARRPALLSCGAVSAQRAPASWLRTRCCLFGGEP